MADTREFFPDSVRFDLVPLAEGVHAAIATPGGGAGCNAGIIDLGDRTLVFDTFKTPQAAQVLRRAAEQLTGRPAALVINSHWHEDHVSGNGVFSPATPIVATAVTRRLMLTRLPDELDHDRRDLPAFIRSLEAALATAPDEPTRRALATRLADSREYAAALATPQLRLPDLTFAGGLTFHGTQRSAQLFSFGGGHTESDAILHLPDDRIAFVGDLVCFGVHPYLPDGDPDAWVVALEQVQALAPAAIVPGHGRVGAGRELALMFDYLHELQRLCRRLAREGAPLDQAARVPVPEPYATWLEAPFFGANLRFLYARGSGAPSA